MTMEEWGEVEAKMDAEWKWLRRWRPWRVIEMVGRWRLLLLFNSSGPNTNHQLKWWKNLITEFNSDSWWLALSLSFEMSENLTRTSKQYTQVHLEVEYIQWQHVRLYIFFLVTFGIYCWENRKTKESIFLSFINLFINCDVICFDIYIEWDKM